MSAESHRKYLERAALREAQKAINRKGQDSFTLEDFLSLRIQVIEEWKRVLCGSLGAAAIGIGIYVFRSDSPENGVLLCVAGVLLISAAILGWRSTVEAALNGVDLVSLFDALF